MESNLIVIFRLTLAYASLEFFYFKPVNEFGEFSEFLLSLVGQLLCTDVMCHPCVKVKRYGPTSVHRKYRCFGSQGCWPWLQPLLASGLAVTSWNTSVGSFPPAAVARDLTSNVSY